MEINNFSAIIELVATMSIAFVAVEYVKSYTSELCERIFDFSKYIDNTFRGIKELVETNIETLNHIPPIVINGISTNSKIEETKRKHEEFKKSIELTIDNKKNMIATECQARSMSSLCFFTFLFNVLLLFIGSIEYRHPVFAHIFVSFFSILGIIYLILGWIFGENEKNIRFLRFASLRYSVVSFVIVLFLAICASLLDCFLLNWSFIENVWWYLLLISIFLSYINFIVFVFKIKNRANIFKKKIIGREEELKTSLDDMDNDVKELLSSNNLSQKLKVN